MASAAVCMQGLRAPSLLSGSGIALRGEPLKPASALTTGAAPKTLRIRAATQNINQGVGTKNLKKIRPTQPVPGTVPSGTRTAKKLKVVGEKGGKIRDKVRGEPVSIKLLSRVEQLKLLSKAEKAGLLSAAENVGLSLSSIEKLGLLSKAESFGALSAATDPKTPALLLYAALSFLVLGPAFVYFVPEDSAPLVVVQVVVALVSVLGGSAAFAASSFVSALQSSD